MGHFHSWEEMHEAVCTDNWIEENYPREYDSLESMVEFHEYCVKEYGSGLDWSVSEYVVWQSVQDQVDVARCLYLDGQDESDGEWLDWLIFKGNRKEVTL
jgi:hypothetical protein